MLDHLREDDVPMAVLRIKTADTLANARSVVADLRRHGPETWTRFHAGAVDQLWYYRSLVDVFRRVSRSPLVDELDRVVTELERLTRHTPDTDA